MNDPSMRRTRGTSQSQPGLRAIDSNVFAGEKNTPTTRAKGPGSGPVVGVEPSVDWAMGSPSRAGGDLQPLRFEKRPFCALEIGEGLVVVEQRLDQRELGVSEVGLEREDLERGRHAVVELL